MPQDTYPLPDHSLPYIHMADHHDYLVRFRKLAETLGVTTKNTRIERYEQYLQTVLSGDKRDRFELFQPSNDYAFEHERDLHLYVLREVHELMWIFRGINENLPKGIEQKIATVVGGADFAALDVNSKSRDVQFELRIASYFCLRGYDVDLSLATDIIASLNRDTYYVECKRVGSQRQLKKRVGEARRQLDRRMPKRREKRRTFGVCAIDVTKVAYPHNGLTFGVTSDHAKHVIQDKLERVSNSLEPDQFSSKVLLVWLQVHIASLISYPNQFSSRMSSLFSLNPRLGYKARKSFQNLRDVLEAGDEPDPKEHPPTELTLRKSIAMPKGTLFGWDEHLIECYLNRGELPEYPPEQVVANLKVEEVEYEFTYFEFKTLTEHIDEDNRIRIGENAVEAQLELICEMYGRRYPYAEIGKDE